METRELSRDDYVSAQGIKLHYREWGDPAAPDLLILHGLTGHAWEFNDLASHLASHFHVIVLNQRGHGASEWGPDYTPDVMADDIAAAIEALGLVDVRVVGHSMGGFNAWNCAARYPSLIERLALLDIGPDVMATEQAQQLWMESLEQLRQTTFESPQQAVAAYLDGFDGPTAGHLRQYVLDNLWQRDDGVWIWRYDAAGLKGWVETAKSSDEQWAALRRVTCPVLIVRAGESWAIEPQTMERMVSEIPDARPVEISGSGHDIHIEQPEALLRELRRFLNVD